MVRRPLRPHFGHDDEQRLIKTLGEARTLALKCSSAQPFASPRYQKCHALADSIDVVAEELTGDRMLFHEKSHGGTR